MFGIAYAARTPIYGGYVPPSCTGGCWTYESGGNTSGLIRSILSNYATTNKIDIPASYEDKTGGFDASDRRVVMQLQQAYNRQNPKTPIAVDGYWGRQTADAFKQVTKIDTVRDLVEKNPELAKLSQGNTIQEQLRQAGYEYNATTKTWEDKGAQASVSYRDSVGGFLNDVVNQKYLPGGRDAQIDFNNIPDDIKSDTAKFLKDTTKLFGDNDISKGIFATARDDIRSCGDADCVKRSMDLAADKFTSDKVLEYYQKMTNAPDDATRAKILREANDYFDKISNPNTKDAILNPTDGKLAYSQTFLGATPEQIKAYREALKDCKDSNCLRELKQGIKDGDLDKPAEKYDPQTGFLSSKVNKVTECKALFYAGGMGRVPGYDTPGKTYSLVQIDQKEKGKPTSFLQISGLKPQEQLRPGDKFGALPFKQTATGGVEQGVTTNAVNRTTNKPHRFECCAELKAGDPNTCAKVAGTSIYYGRGTKGAK
jgi:hypothetical protein